MKDNMASRLKVVLAVLLLYSCFYFSNAGKNYFLLVIWNSMVLWVVTPIRWVMARALKPRF